MPIWFSFGGQPRPELSDCIEQAVLAVQDDVLQRAARQEFKSSVLLALLAPHLERSGFEVERPAVDGAPAVNIPIHGHGAPELGANTFRVDAVHSRAGWLLEAEAGQATINNKHAISLLRTIIATHPAGEAAPLNKLALILPYKYRSGNRVYKPYQKARGLFSNLFAVPNLNIGVQGIFLIEYATSAPDIDEMRRIADHEAAFA